MTLLNVCSADKATLHLFGFNEHSQPNADIPDPQFVQGATMAA